MDESTELKYINVAINRLHYIILSNEGDVANYPRLMPLQMAMDQAEKSRTYLQKNHALDQLGKKIVSGTKDGLQEAHKSLDAVDSSFHTYE